MNKKKFITVMLIGVAIAFALLFVDSVGKGAFYGLGQIVLTIAFYVSTESK